MCRIIILFCILLPSLSIARTIIQAPVSSLYQRADFVGYVQIVAGHSIENGGANCGASYTGRVIDQFKGDPLRTIEFGPYLGAKIGINYVVFLKYLDDDFSQREVRTEGDDDCQSKHGPWIVMQAGMALIEESWIRELNPRQAFLVPTEYVSFPNKFEYVKVPRDENPELSETRWMLKEDVLIYLRRLMDEND